MNNCLNCDGIGLLRVSWEKCPSCKGTGKIDYLANLQEDQFRNQINQLFGQGYYESLLGNQQINTQQIRDQMNAQLGGIPKTGWGTPTINDNYNHSLIEENQRLRKELQSPRDMVPGEHFRSLRIKYEEEIERADKLLEENIKLEKKANKSLRTYKRFRRMWKYSNAKLMKWNDVWTNASLIPKPVALLARLCLYSTALIGLRQCCIMFGIMK